MSAPTEQSAQCGCRCFAPPWSGAVPVLPKSPELPLATHLIPAAVQTSNNAGCVPGRALASSGHSALSAMATMASQEVNRNFFEVGRMGQIISRTLRDEKVTALTQIREWPANEDD